MDELALRQNSITSSERHRSVVGGCELKQSNGSGRTSTAAVKRIHRIGSSITSVCAADREGPKVPRSARFPSSLDQNNLFASSQFYSSSECDYLLDNNLIPRVVAAEKVWVLPRIWRLNNVVGAISWLVNLGPL